jgi:transposase-like protein
MHPAHDGRAGQRTIALGHHHHQVPEATPTTITLDGYVASHRAVREMIADDQLAADTKLRSSKHPNSLIEQGHRGVKLRIDSMLGFKRFRTAAVTIVGTELLCWIHQGQLPSAGCVSKSELRPPLECGAGGGLQELCRKQRWPGLCFQPEPI